MNSRKSSHRKSVRDSLYLYRLAMSHISNNLHKILVINQALDEIKAFANLCQMNQFVGYFDKLVVDIFRNSVLLMSLNPTLADLLRNPLAMEYSKELKLEALDLLNSFDILVDQVHRFE